MYCLLFYDYPADILERRAPHREAHLKLAGEWVERGELVLGGAFEDPVDGAVLVFRVDQPARVEDFVRNDPYVAAGLVENWRVRPWTVVVGSALS